MTHSTTETSHTLANPAFMPKESTPVDNPVETQSFEVKEFGNDEPITLIEVSVAEEPEWDEADEE